MPLLSLGESRNGLPRSPGASSIQTLSSFCQSVSGPSILRAPSMTLANGGGLPGGSGGDAAATTATPVGPDAERATGATPNGSVPLAARVGVAVAGLLVAPDT